LDDGRFHVYLYGSAKTKELLPGQTTHAGVRTGAIHLARGEYEQLRRYGEAFVAARIAHEASEVLEWEAVAQRNDIPLDQIREWENTHFDEAQRLHSVNHEMGARIEQWVSGDNKVGGKIIRTQRGGSFNISSGPFMPSFFLALRLLNYRLARRTK